MKSYGIRRIKVRKYLITILLIVILFLLIFYGLYLSYSEGKESYIDREEVIIEVFMIPL